MKESGIQEGAGAGWRKCTGNPVLGGDLGTCFDVTVLREQDEFCMWFSWRPKKSIALVRSRDGIHWSEPIVVLEPDGGGVGEDAVNRPCVVKSGTGYHMWYTAQTKTQSRIGYTVSPDGMAWRRAGDGPALSPELPWEKAAVMCPHVVLEERKGLFRMWYSGGEQYEPDAIGYATSEDGIRWTKWSSNPIFTGDPRHAWERHKVTACQVIEQGGWHWMFYIGFRDVHHAQIGLARSRNGLADWERHPGNPILSPGKDSWDGDACYKPYAVFDKELDLWRLWYNGRRGHVEQIGMAVHEGSRLWPGP